MIREKKEYILCAAWKRISPRKTIDNSIPYHIPNDILNIELGYRHHDIYARFGNELSLESDAMGFYTSYGRFVNRVEGMKIAYEAGQVDKEIAFWDEKSINFFTELGCSCEGVSAGDLAPLASENLYCCSPDGDTLNE